MKACVVSGVPFHRLSASIDWYHQRPSTDQERPMIPRTSMMILAAPAITFAAAGGPDIRPSADILAWQRLEFALFDGSARQRQSHRPPRRLREQ